MSNYTEICLIDRLRERSVSCTVEVFFIVPILTIVQPTNGNRWGHFFNPFIKMSIFMCFVTFSTPLSVNLVIVIWLYKLNVNDTFFYVFLHLFVLWCRVGLSFFLNKWSVVSVTNKMNINLFCVNWETLKHLVTLYIPYNYLGVSCLCESWLPD